MKATIFTPSHNTKFLGEAYQSLLRQTLDQWEWIIVLNGEAKQDSLPSDMLTDPRVKIFTTDKKGVGALKSYACSLGSGEIYLELDHDDIFAPEAVKETVDAFEAHPEVGVVYSNFTQINEDGSPNNDRFGEVYGWRNKYRELSIEGDKYLENIGFTDHPHNFARIYAQPNHLRAFRRSIYEKVGGYNEQMEILDDQDLLCRMYIAAPFHHINKMLYFQRVYPGNSQKKFGHIIPNLTEELYYKYINDMALAWAKRKGLLAIDLGGGHRPAEGYISLDLENAQIIHDVTKGLPFKDNEIGVIRAVDFLEHIPDKIGIINEIYRCLTHGGMLLSMTPSTDGWGAFSDPTHVAYYNERSFWYYTREAQKRFVSGLNVKFQASYLKTEDTSAIYGDNVKHVVANLIALKTSQNGITGQPVPNTDFQGINYFNS